MATVNFSVPDEVKKAFDREFRGQNKSAVIAALMRRAVDEAEERRRRAELFRVLTVRRSERPAASDRQIRTARRRARQ